eukprot:scaffold22065_cov64-Phaeocystis_antarctica.AAC.8
MGSCCPSLWHRFQRCTLSGERFDFVRCLPPVIGCFSHRGCTLWDPVSLEVELARYTQEGGGAEGAHARRTTLREVTGECACSQCRSLSPWTDLRHLCLRQIPQPQRKAAWTSGCAGAAAWPPHRGRHPLLRARDSAGYQAAAAQRRRPRTH